ncbi:MAG: SoxR reducing system RseC family protein [Deltaproteobacteria bacterium]|nr:SoxR reducing system RseC family protein [Deltaproteobacteria bacterium]
MIEEIGTIVELRPDRVAMVQCRKSHACKGCASANLCSLGRDDGGRVVEAHNPLQAQIGERVRIATTAKAFYQSSFLVYIVPLIGLVIGGLIGQSIGRQIGVDPNITSFLGGFFFLVFALLGVGSLNRRLPKERYMPTVVEVLSPADEDAENTAGSEMLSHGH